MILINFKIYKETFGDRALELARICKKVGEQTGVKIIPVVSALDAYRIIKAVEIKVMLQHVDPENEGAKSGMVSREQAKILGASGTLINHSEHRLKPGTIKKMLKDWDKDFESVVCLQTSGQMENWAKNIKPAMIAYEPQEFIGNRERSVASEKPEIIRKMVEHYKNIPVLVGAGIHSVDDVKVSLGLGAAGVLVATDVIRAKDPEKELLELAKGF